MRKDDSLDISYDKSVMLCDRVSETADAMFVAKDLLYSLLWSSGMKDKL